MDYFDDGERREHEGPIGYNNSDLCEPMDTLCPNCGEELSEGEVMDGGRCRECVTQATTGT